MRQHGPRGSSAASKKRTTIPDEAATRAGPRPARARLHARRGPNEMWVADITYLRTWSGFLYLALMLDCYSRRSSAGRSPPTCAPSWSRRARDGDRARRPEAGPDPHFRPRRARADSMVVATPRWWRCRVGTMRERQREVQLYRGQVPSPGRPTVAWREDRVRFWAAVARGLKTEDAAGEAGVSSPVAFRWFRHAGGVNPCLSPDGVGPLPVVRRAGGDRAPPSAGSWRAGDRAAAAAQPVDDLAGAAPERVDADVAARVQGVDRAVACRASCPPAEGRPSWSRTSGSARTCRSGCRVRCAVAGGRAVGPAGAEVERSEQAASRGSPLGAGLEPGADREPAAGRLPR